MGIKRNEVATPNWEPGDYALLDKDNLFSDKLWKRTIYWELLLEQVKKTEEACQPIDRYIYPSRLFSAYVDILEANLYMLDDLFYFQTGIRIGNQRYPDSLIMSIYYLRFWNMDSYKEIESIQEAIIRIKKHLMVCIKQAPLSEIADAIIRKSLNCIEWGKTDPDAFEYDYLKQPDYSYACDAYRDSETDKNALVEQFVRILNLLDNYDKLLLFFTSDFIIGLLKFEELKTSFRQSEKGQIFIKPWRRDFEGSRDSLISKMEKDPELGQWVNRYTHLKEDKDIIRQLFCDENGFAKNKEETFNTDNWIKLLTIASILQEYDEQQNAVADASDKDESILLKLSLYFKEENTARRFLNSVRQMNDKEVIALVKKYRDVGLCTDTSKNLWKVLHDAKLYKPIYTNWNAQLNKR